MDAKKFAIASVAGGVMLFLTGFVFYGVLLSEFMEANAAPGLAKDMPDMAPLILGELVLAAFLTRDPESMVRDSELWRGGQGRSVARPAAWFGVEPRDVRNDELGGTGDNPGGHAGQRGPNGSHRRRDWRGVGPVMSRSAVERK